MKIAIPKESREHETRVAATPETVKKFIKLGADATVQAGAGDTASIPDADYENAGAFVEKTFAATLKGADVVLKIQRPGTSEIKSFAKGQRLFCTMSPYGDRETLDALAAKGVDCFAMEFMPRITRAQSMDVLSSQANLAGYKAVLEAANAYGKGMPQMMTAAGTVAASISWNVFGVDASQKLMRLSLTVIRLTCAPPRA